jgi:hypothetical protein
MVDERDKIRAMRGATGAFTELPKSTGTPFGQAGSAPTVGSVSEVSGLKITGTERNAAKEAEAKAIGYSAEYIASRGGINSQGYFNDTPLSGQLSAAEYKSVTKSDGTINTAGMARILQEKQIAELVAQGMSKDEATRRISTQYGEFGIGGWGRYTLNWWNYSYWRCCTRRWHGYSGRCSEGCNRCTCYPTG